MTKVHWSATRQSVVYSALCGTVATGEYSLMMTENPKSVTCLRCKQLPAVIRALAMETVNHA